jgi:protein pelota
MRLIRQDPAIGLLRLRLETPSDLWRVARLIHAGDLVGASTTRRDPEAPEETPGAQRERRRVWLVVRTEQVEFHGFSRHVRVTGPIVEGPFDLGRHHTLDLADGEELTVQKDALAAADRMLLEEGLASRGDPTVVIAAVDWGESSIVRLRGRSIEPVVDLNRTLSGKRYKGGQAEKDRQQYIDELTRAVLREAEAATVLVVAGPGFLKEELGKRLLASAPGLRGRLRLYPTAESGRSGVEELLRSGKATEALAGTVAAEESERVEQLVQALAGGRRAAVGLAEVAEATAQGALETLLVSEAVLRLPALEPVLDGARRSRAHVLVVREEGEAGRRLKSLGNVGAILRYDWAPTRPRGSAP